jgi:hypothetical protein
MGARVHVLESSDFLAAVNKDVGVGIIVGQLQLKQDQSSWVVLVKNRNHLALLVDLNDMVLSRAEITYAKLGQRILLRRTHEDLTDSC